MLGVWDKPDNTLLMFLLRHRLREKYSTNHGATEAEKESIRAEVLEEIAATEQEAAEELERHIQRRIEAARAETREATLREIEEAKAEEDALAKVEEDRRWWRKRYREQYPDFDDEEIEEMVEIMMRD